MVILCAGLVCSAWAPAQLGERTEALDRLREAKQLIELDPTSQPFFSYQALGRACLLLGRLEDGRRLGDRVLEFSQSLPGFAAHALHLHGDIAAHPDRFDAERGEAHYRQALA